jgi:hypothetical protein
MDPGYARTYNAIRGLPADTGVDLLEVGSDHDDGVSVRKLLDEVLRPGPGPRVDPHADFGISPADTSGLDRSRRSVPGMPGWLLVLELRIFSPSKYDPFERPGTYAKIDAEMADQNMARLTEVARAGLAGCEAAASGCGCYRVAALIAAAISGARCGVTIEYLHATGTMSPRSGRRREFRGAQDRGRSAR